MADVWKLGGQPKTVRDLINILRTVPENYEVSCIGCSPYVLIGDGVVVMEDGDYTDDWNEVE